MANKHNVIRLAKAEPRDAAEAELFPKLDQMRQDADDAGECLVMTWGVYDVPHAGHLDHLEWSRKLFESKGQVGKLAVAVWSDANVRDWKGQNRPIYDIEKRLRFLNALEKVDYAFEIPYQGLIIPQSGIERTKKQVYEERIILATPALSHLQPDFCAVGESGTDGKIIYEDGRETDVGFRERETIITLDTTYKYKRHSTTSATQMVGSITGKDASQVNENDIRHLNSVFIPYEPSGNVLLRAVQHVIEQHFTELNKNDLQQLLTSTGEPDTAKAIAYIRETLLPFMRLSDNNDR